MTHPFQAADLGIAPFRCIGVRENVYSAAPGHSQAGGTCTYCGTGIRWEYLIRSADARTFVVGSDCVEKTGGESEVSDFRAVRLEHARMQRQARKAATRAEREATWARERADRAAVRAAAFAEAEPVLYPRLMAYAGHSAFMKDMRAACEQWGSLTPGQLAAVRKVFASMDTQDRQASTSKAMGQPGERLRGIMARVTGCRLINPDRERFEDPRYLVSLETQDGNALTWWTSKPWETSESFHSCTFTVKKHDEFRGIVQTVVQRVTFP